MRIAIDGPSGAGKSSLAKELARRLGLAYVDTGALYRTVGLYARRSCRDISDAAEVADSLAGCRVSLEFVHGAQHVILGSEDVSELIRTPQASADASVVSAQKAVREFLLGVQRDMIAADNVIMDGRDIGTVIMPDADVKLFVFASAEARARRRFAELEAKGEQTDFAEVLEAMEKRDRDDREREISPCIPAPDAILLDNSDIGFEETVEKALELIGSAVK